MKRTWRSQLFLSCSTWRSEASKASKARARRSHGIKWVTHDTQHLHEQHKAIMPELPKKVTSRGVGYGNATGYCALEDGCVAPPSLVLSVVWRYISGATTAAEHSSLRCICLASRQLDDIWTKRTTKLFPGRSEERSSSR